MRLLHSGIVEPSIVQAQQFAILVSRKRNTERVDEMTYVNALRSNAADISISASIYRLIARVADYRAYRQTVRELNNLSARELADLGLHRSSIPATAYAAVYGDGI